MSNITDPGSKMRFRSFLSEAREIFMTENSIVPVLDKLFEKFESRRVVRLLEVYTDRDQSFNRTMKFFGDIIRTISNEKQQKGVVGLEYEDLMSIGAMVLFELWEEQNNNPEIKAKYGDDFYKQKDFLNLFRTSFYNRILDEIRHTQTDKAKANYKAMPSLSTPAHDDEGDMLQDTIPDNTSDFTKDLERFDEKGFYKIVGSYLQDPIAKQIVAQTDEISPEMRELIGAGATLANVPRKALVQVLDMPEIPINTGDPMIDKANIRRRENRIDKAKEEISKIVINLVQDKEIRDKYNIPDDFLK